MMFKRVHIDSSGTRLVQGSGTICAILEETIIGNTPGKYFFNLDQWFNRNCHLNKSFWTDRCWI